MANGELHHRSKRDRLMPEHRTSMQRPVAFLEELVQAFQANPSTIDSYRQIKEPELIKLIELLYGADPVTSNDPTNDKAFLNDYHFSDTWNKTRMLRNTIGTVFAGIASDAFVAQAAINMPRRNTQPLLPINIPQTSSIAQDIARYEPTLARRVDEHYLEEVGNNADAIADGYKKTIIATVNAIQALPEEHPLRRMHDRFEEMIDFGLKHQMIGGGIDTQNGLVAGFLNRGLGTFRRNARALINSIAEEGRRQDFWHRPMRREEFATAFESSVIPIYSLLMSGSLIHTVALDALRENGPDGIHFRQGFLQKRKDGKYIINNEMWEAEIAHAELLIYNRYLEAYQGNLEMSLMRAILGDLVIPTQGENESLFYPHHPFPTEVTFCPANITRPDGRGSLRDDIFTAQATFIRGINHRHNTIRPGRYARTRRSRFT